MAFKKIKLANGEKCKDIEYLREKEYTGLFGRKVSGSIRSYYKDIESNSYIIEIGCTNPSLETDGYSLYIFVFCIDDNIVGISAEPFSSGNFRENNLEEKWIIRNIVYPDGWKKERYPNFEQLVTNAFEAISLYQFDKPESVKKVDVIFDDTIEN